MPSVAVLLSVTDHTTYLGPLLDSILEQDDVDAGIRARIDRPEAARGVVAAVEQRRIDVLETGPALGVPQTYLRLIELTPSTEPYYAFADHDDLWDRRKLSRACAALHKAGDDVPTLWICQIDPFTDAPAACRAHRATFRPRRPLDPSAGNALTQTVTPGCAMVWNRALHELVRSRLPSSGVLMHDSWLYLVAAAVGRVIVDQEPLVRYRIHPGNAIGLDTAWRHRLQRFLTDRRNHRPTLESQAAEALRCVGDLMDPATRRLVEIVAHGSPWQRMRAVGQHGLRRDRPSENLALRARLLLPPRWMGSRPVGS